MAVRTWLCERDDRDAAAPFCATLLLDDEPIASGRGTDELTAFARLMDVAAQKGIDEGRILGMQTLMRQWRNFLPSSS